MLPGLRLVLAAIIATIVIVVLGFAQLVKLQVAQSHSASLGPVEARFAGLAFAERADWMPVGTSRVKSLELLAPFANLPTRPPPLDEGAADATVPVRSVALTRPEPEPPPETLAVETRPVEVASLAPIVEPNLPPAPGEPEWMLPTPETVELDVATILPVTEPETNVSVPTIPAAEPAPLTPADVASGSAETAATPQPSLPDDTVTVTASLPDTAAMSGDVVPIPVARPVIAPPRKAQPAPAKKKAARKRAPSAKSSQAPASAAPSNPFGGLFGGPNTGGNTPN